MHALLLFLKAPQVAQVKTRLARHIGSEGALQVYRALVARQFSALPENARIEVHYSPQDAGSEMQAWLGEETALYPQPDGGLGERLEHAVESAFTRGARTVTCIGGDCPQLELRHFDEANALLEAEHDVVFGPSEDGGYYLIALRSPQPELFKGIPWSATNTLEASLKKASALGLKVGLLETLYDVDAVAELERALRDGLIELEG